VSRKNGRKPPPHRRYTLNLNGELKGFRVVMGAMSGRDLIRMQRGDMTEADVLELVQARCLEHDFNISDLTDLEFWIVAEILEAWSDAQTEVAIPKETASS
jgi:hypothetical protein